MKKKICFVAEYMYCGGTERSLLSLLPFLSRDKYDITLLLMKIKGDLVEELPNDIKVFEIPLPEDEQEELLYGRKNALKNAIKRKNMLKAVKKAFRGFRMSLCTKDGCDRRLWYYKNIDKKVKTYPEEFDVVIDYMGYGLFNTYYAAYKVRGKQKISWIHFEPDEVMPDFYLFSSVLKEYQYVMCVSEQSRQQMKRMIPELADRFCLFYNIVDNKSIISKAKESELKKKEDEITIVSIGRLDPQKGFDIGIRAVQLLYEQGYPVKWYIIGEGWQREELEKIIRQNKAASECVELVGQKINPYPYIDMCDIYFQPSRHEGYCIALAEARAFCKPIVAADFAGAREQLINRKTGIIVPCKEQELFNALKLVIDDENLRKKLKVNLLNQDKGSLKQVIFLEEIIENEKKSGT